jgi:cyanate lyase
MDIKTAVGIALQKKGQKNLTFDDLSEKTGRDPMFIAAALNGMQRLNNTDLDTIAQVLELDAETTAVFAQMPVRVEPPSL